MSYEELYPHPNSNADIYRNMTPAGRPPVDDPHLQFIAVHNDETAILGASNMTDRYWSGTVWVFNECPNLERTNKFATARIESGVIDAGFLDSRKFIVAEDSGVVQILEVSKADDAWKPELDCGQRYQHDDSITSLAVFDNKVNFISVGMDCCIKVWDAPEFVAVRSYIQAHTHTITSVDTKPQCESKFISTSLDCEAIVWDVRQSTPAHCVYKKDDCGLTAVAWDPLSDHLVALGAEDGSITMLDIRQPETSISESLVFRRPVHKLKYHPKRNNWLAGCSDDIVVKVVDPLEKISVVYEDTRHYDFVRGLAWYKDQLLTCSWDDTVLQHDISSNK